MFLYGASGHAKVIIDILRAGHESIEALFDDNVEVTSLLGHPVLRPSEVRGPLIVSIGNNRIRKRIVDTLSVEFGCAIHPLSIVSELADIGEGSRHCIINTGASVDHECVIEDYVHISPHSTLCGNVLVGEGSWIGAGTTIIPGVKIGKWSVIGAGSVVTKDIPDHVLAVGNKCKIIKSI